MLGKLNKVSPVHRNALVDYILIKHLGSVKFSNEAISELQQIVRKT
jgi:hypothetical protein